MSVRSVSAPLFKSSSTIYIDPCRQATCKGDVLSSSRIFMFTPFLRKNLIADTFLVALLLKKLISFGVKYAIEFAFIRPCGLD